MKLTLAVLLFSALSYANSGRPNFTCQTNPNAAGMKIKALVYTYYYSGNVKVDLYHSSTYRDELIISETSRPEVQTKYEIRSSAKTEAPAAAVDEDVFIPLPSIPGNSLQYSLKFKQGNKWMAEFSFSSGNDFLGSRPAVQKTYKMNCLKL